MNILIVLSDVMYRELVANICRDVGDYEIIEAGSLAEADEVRKSFTPDIVFSGLILPDGGGPSRFPAIRDQNPKVKICLLSTNAEPPSHGADKFIRRDHHLRTSIPAWLAEIS